jgi:hypothetical protein
VVSIKAILKTTIQVCPTRDSYMFAVVVLRSDMAAQRSRLVRVMSEEEILGISGALGCSQHRMCAALQ